MRRKLIAMDIDGTAVCDDYSMSPGTRAAIEKAGEDGHITAFVTGRRDIDMLTLEKEEADCVDYLILNNGGKLTRVADKKVIVNEMIGAAACRQLLTYCLNRHLQIQVCSGLTWLVSEMTDETMEYAQSVGVIPKVFFSLEELELIGRIRLEDGLEGFMATRDREEVGRYIDRNLPSMCYVDSEPMCIDIMTAGVSKWKGIMHLAGLEGILQEDIITVGNYYNDIDMIEKAAVGVAVANSPKKVKQAADYVTLRDNNHDAIAEVLAEFCGISIV